MSESVVQPDAFLSLGGQRLMMQRHYCASAVEQKRQRRCFLARAALKQRHLHSPALPPLGPLLRGDELQPRAGMEMSCISSEI